jgi:serine/threonine protein kinase
MLYRGGHNASVDYYCIGALLYELVTGLPPYYSKDQNELFRNILNNDLEFPDKFGLSFEIKCLLSKLLVKDPF